MNRAGHNSISSARRTTPAANQLNRLAITGDDHNSTSSARRTTPAANQLSRLAITGDDHNSTSSARRTTPAANQLNRLAITGDDHNSTSSARRTTPAANQLSRLAITGDEQISQMSSAGPAREQHDQQVPCFPRAINPGCATLVHDLANTIAAVLMNAQVMGWKLPPYSHLKRPLREIERNAQRGSELMKCLLRRLAPETAAEEEMPTMQKMQATDHGEQGPMIAVTPQEPGADSRDMENLPPLANSRPAPGLFSAAAVALENELTSRCDGCPSTFPKKG